MYHLHLVMKQKEETRYELSFRQKMMYENVAEENIDDIVIYNDSSFTEADIGFIRNDIVNELKKQYNVFEEKMRYSGNLNIIMDSRIIITTNDVEELLMKLYGLADFYQMMYKYRLLEPQELDIYEETENIEEGGDGDGGGFRGDNEAKEKKKKKLRQE